MYAKGSMIICKSCHKLKIKIVVPLLGRMNTNAKRRGGLHSGSIVRSVAIEFKHGDGLPERLSRKLQGMIRK